LSIHIVTFISICPMKYKNLLFLFLCLSAFYVKAQDNFLMSQKFFLHKGDTLDVHLVVGTQFKIEDEYRYDNAKTSKFMLYDGGKKIDLKPAAKDSAAPVFAKAMTNPGLVMVEMIRNIPTTPIEREVYGKYLTDEGLTKLAESVNNSNQMHFREKKTCYMKILVQVDKPTGGDFDKQLGEDYEIVLKKNPYKMNYGEDVNCVLYYKGKPAKASPVDIFLKTISGSVFPQRVVTDDKGEFSFTTTREGAYLIRSVRTVAANGGDAEFETIEAAFTFVFNSENDSPNSFKEFGLKDLH
jgi:hypothetical protein